MHGNRDFLIGERFCAAAGARLLPDPSTMKFRVKTLLMHGDTLCTDDIEYQAWRRRSRDPRHPGRFSGEAKLAEPGKAVLEMRETSRRVVQEKAPRSWT